MLALLPAVSPPHMEQDWLGYKIWPLLYHQDNETPPAEAFKHIYTL